MPHAGAGGNFDLTGDRARGGSPRGLWALTRNHGARGRGVRGAIILGGSATRSTHASARLAADVRAETPGAAAELISSHFIATRSAPCRRARRWRGVRVGGGPGGDDWIMRVAGLRLTHARRAPGRARVICASTTGQSIGFGVERIDAGALEQFAGAGADGGGGPALDRAKVPAGVEAPARALEKRHAIGEPGIGAQPTALS